MLFGGLGTCLFAGPVLAADSAAADPAAAGDLAEVVVTGFRAPASSAIDTKRNRRHRRCDQGRGHRQVPGPQPGRIAAAHSRRGDRPRRRRRPHITVRGLGPTSPACASTAWKRSPPPAAPIAPAATTARAASTSTSSPPSCSTASQCASRPRPTWKKVARCHRRPRHLPAVRLQRAGVRRLRARPATTTWPGRAIRAPR